MAYNKEKGIMEIDCFTCGAKFQFGPHIYAGKVLQYYKVNVCNICINANCDGWGPHAEDKILQHLKDENIPIPTRNAKGWLPVDPLPRGNP